MRLPAGKSAELMVGSRVRWTPGAITALMCKVDAVDREEALARTLLTITFDGAEQPQVAVPLGDFFGRVRGSTRSSRRSTGFAVTARWWLPRRNRLGQALPGFKELILRRTRGVLQR